MNIKGKTVLITGAGGGIGKCLVQSFIENGAIKIYAADLNIESLNELKARYDNKVIPIKLDVTKQEDIENCRHICEDIDILINNAGVELAFPVMSEHALKAAKIEINVNFLGVHSLCVAFWDVLKSKESASIINMLSIASFITIPNLSTYCASKVAAHSITQAFRHASLNTNIKVIGIYPGYVNTNMTKNIDVEKSLPQEIATNICDDFEKGILDIFPDPMSKKLSKEEWHQNPILDCVIYPQ